MGEDADSVTDDIPTLLVTLDTNLTNVARIEAIRSALDSMPHELVIVSTTARERAGQLPIRLEQVAEPFVVGESLIGGVHFLYRDDQDGAILEAVLKIIDGGFPKPGRRTSLSPGHRNQIRDAMIFAAHVRARRHVLVTTDVSAFVDKGRREKLEQLGRTYIRTPEEFLSLAEVDGGFSALVEPPDRL